MRTLIILLVVALSACSTPNPLRLPAGSGKVIIDEDPGELNDDALATAMLLGSAQVEVLGITTVGGNTWPEEGAAHALRLLELLGRTDVPVVQGATADPRDRGVDPRTLPYSGALARPRPRDARRLDPAPRLGYAASEPMAVTPSEFIADQVKRHPGQVTILALGPATNLARAVEEHPEIVPLVKGVVFMGGAFDVPGNVTGDAEFNWWWDPRAAKVALDAPFKEKIVVPLDACQGLLYDKELHDRVVADAAAPLSKPLRDLHGPAFAADPGSTVPVWDTIAVAVFLQPGIVADAGDRPVSADARTGKAVGGTAVAHVPGEVDPDAFRDLYVSRLTAKRAS
ncbi:nucleoside hydrolase [Nonomuraea pusilla]|uniref:Inosine-uridine nucleoside N-ribohydrolase n=1 Tax=Nonomuraea pusilla TaxID=46177 RepID=A0A1H7ZXD2_9ACTN|nr:nucleoside hydrolase [Nonomuraea pusilla]SEM62248.1 Inosine-uridine nucleoside N-ribohydrolase [Nonomuraea pusilla]